MKRRCLNCMKEFEIPAGDENSQNVCPMCGYQEGTPPKEIYHLYPGMRLRDRYVIGTVLGFGGFGITYKAWDENLSTVVAIKEYYPTGLVQRIPGERVVIIYEGQRRKEYFSGLSRFLDEARNMAKFHDNPNIVHVDDFFEENNTAYIVMEYLDGISLKGFLKQEHGKVEYDVAIEVTMSLIEALRQIHKEGIIHRDISPDNIFLCDGGKIKLIDFGAARFSDEEKEVTRSIILKPGFAPPEQYQSKSIQGPWTDIYAVCATLYRCITGTLPDESVNRVVEDVVKAPIELDPTIPEYVSTTIMKGMALNSELRFRNVDELKKALCNEIKVLNVEKELKKRKKKRIIGISIAAALLLVGGLVAFNIYKTRNPELDEATVTVWVSYGEGEDKAAKEQMVMDMSKSFMSDQGAVTVEAVAIPKEEYAERLEQAHEEGNMPTIYEQEYASDDVLADAASVKNVYKNLNNMDDYYFLKDNKKALEKSKIVPLGFNVPVVYVRTQAGKDVAVIEDNFVLTDFSQLESGKYYCDPLYYDWYINSFGGSMRWNGEIKVDEQGEIMLEAMKNEAVAKNIFANDEKALELFGNKEQPELLYYITSALALPRIDAAASGTYQMRPFGTDKIYGEFTNIYCIDGKAGKDEIRAAELLFKYFLETGPQNILHLQNVNNLPLNKNAYKEYLSNDGAYENISGYFDKLVFYPEEQEEIDEYIQNYIEENK